MTDDEAYNKFTDWLQDESDIMIREKLKEESLNKLRDKFIDSIEFTRAFELWITNELTDLEPEDFDGEPWLGVGEEEEDFDGDNTETGSDVKDA